MSINIRSGFTSSYMVTASMPSLARTKRYFLPRIAFSRSKLLSVSSAISMVAFSVSTAVVRRSSSFSVVSSLGRGVSSLAGSTSDGCVPTASPGKWLFVPVSVSCMTFSRGSQKVNVVPVPTSEETAISPPSRSMIVLQIDNPRPVPWAKLFSLANR